MGDDAQTRQTARLVREALGARDAARLAVLFAAEATYADPCRTGTSRGVDDVGAHLRLLCDALRDAVVTPLDVLIDHETAALRWVAQLPPPRAHAMEALTWLRTGANGRIVEARTFFDGAVFLPADPARLEPPLVEDAVMAGLGEPVVLTGRDSRGVHFDVGRLRGKVVCLLFAGRAVGSEAQRLAERLGTHFGGDERVVLVVILDASDVPVALRGVARTALGTLRAQAVRRFKEGFERAGKPLPPGVEELVWFLLDEDGSRFAALGIAVPLAAPELAVLDREGRLAWRRAGPADEVAEAGAAAAWAETTR